jgi:hypothetical protein
MDCSGCCFSFSESAVYLNFEFWPSYEGTPVNDHFQTAIEVRSRFQCDDGRSIICSLTITFIANVLLAATALW